MSIEGTYKHLGNSFVENTLSKLSAEDQAYVGETAKVLPKYGILFRNQERRKKIMKVIFFLIWLGLGIGGFFFVRHMYKKR